VRSRSRSDGGFVTAETALALPVLTLVGVLLLGLARAAAAQLSAQDAAGVGARTAARGEPADAVERAVRAVAPPGATVSVRRSDGLVRVVVGTTVSAPGAVAALLPSLSLSAQAVAVDEASPFLPAVASSSDPP
jgi:Flp pilus assembly protein TadG